MEWAYKTMLVTGASGLIGQAIVDAFSGHGIEVHALSRNGETLEKLAGRTGCVPHAIDVSDHEALSALAASLEVDILVHNAGLASPGSIASGEPTHIDMQIDVNLRAVMHLSRLFLPGMIRRNCGHIVMIGSIAGHHTFNGHAAYHATKAALPVLARQLRTDLFGKRIRVTEIAPGMVKTEIFAKIFKTSVEEADRQFFDGYETMLPEDVAAAVFYAVSAPQRVNVSHIEIVPTSQVPGGIQIAQRTE